MAKAAEEASIRPEAFDADSNLFYAQNGTMDVPKFDGTMCNVSDQYFTKSANARWVLTNPNAMELCPLWHQFVQQCCMYDKSLYLYL